MDETAGMMTAAAALMDEPEAPSILLANIQAAKTGDQHAFENVMIATERRVATLAWRILGDAEEVKEALQETFLRVFRHLGHLMASPPRTVAPSVVILEVSRRHIQSVRRGAETA